MFDFIASSMATEAASLPEYTQTRQASAIDSGGHASEAPAQGIKTSNGAIFTGYYKNFHAMPEKDKQAVLEERKRLNISPKKGKYVHKKSNLSSVASKKDKALKKMTREIASLKVKFKGIEKKDDKDSSSEEEDGRVQDNAGDQFGGRKSKKAKKGK